MPLALTMSDPFAPTLLVLALLWLAAKAGGEVALRLKLPAVAGELGIGVGLAVLANLGVILLMFMVGLESTVSQMLRVGGPPGCFV